MRITIGIESSSKMEQLSAILDKFKINVVQMNAPGAELNSIIKGDKNIDPKSLFGIWADKPRSLEEIRKNAWNGSNNMTLK